MKILIMGLPGSGKTTLALQLFTELQQRGQSSTWLNADSVRRMFGDQDFSIEGRLRQAQRLAELARHSSADFIICDFIAPLNSSRKIFNPDFVIWMSTIDKSSYPDTDLMFERPSYSDIEIKNFEYDINEILEKIINARRS